MTVCSKCRGKKTVVASWGDCPIEVDCDHCMGTGYEPGVDRDAELINVIDEILAQEFVLPPVEDDPEGDASVYFSGFDDGLQAVKKWLKGDRSMLEGRLSQ